MIIKSTFDLLLNMLKVKCRLDPNLTPISNFRTLFFDDMKVPVENLLFEAGRGHVVAFNILNIGRVKTAANSLGSAKYALELSAAYANERRQFNVPNSC